MLEIPLYLPYFKHGRLQMPFNRSWVLAPYESRQVVLPMRFPAQSLEDVADAVTISLVRFSPQTNGQRVWGVVENCGSLPRHITPKMAFCSFKTTITHLHIPDRGRIQLEDRGSPVMLRVVSAKPGTVDEILADFPELTSSNLGCCVDYMVAQVPFIHELPRQQQPYPIAPQEERMILEEVEKLKERGVVEETNQEPYLIPVFAIPKKSGGVRLVLDFRKFNACVAFQPFLPVHREHTLASLQPYKVGTALDLCDAYFQVRLAPELHRFFGLAVQGRFFRYKRVPFGYHNSPSEFLRALRPAIQAIRARVQSQVISYMDDLLILSNSLEQHEADLREALAILQERGWRIQPAKCSFFAQRFDFLGNVVTPTGVQPSQSALDRLKMIPVPTTRATWRSVRGWFQQLVRFVANGAQIQEALWKAEESEEEQDWRAFLKTLEEHTIQCVHALKEGDFGVAVDASGVGWGAVLLQHEQIVCCASGLWPASWKHQLSNHLEMEAVVLAMRRFQSWIFGCRVVILTDNGSVASLQNPANQSPFVRRRLDELQQFCPQFCFVPGKTNVLPDLLSRQHELFKEEERG